MCLYPKLLLNRKYTANKKNGGVIPAVTDIRTLYVPTKCGKCIECSKQKAREWQVRLQEDIKYNTNGKFVTLTFNTKSLIELRDKLHKEYTWNISLNDNPKKPKTPNKDIDKRKRQRIIKNWYKINIKYEGYELDNQICILAMRLFNERWRKHNNKALRHWLVTELGHEGTEHIHMHGIIWANDMNVVERNWQYGFIWKGKLVNGQLINYVNEQTVNYCVKYVSKMDKQHQTYKPIVLNSPGIGRDYTGKYNKYTEGKTDETYRTRTGHKIMLPIYWRNKIYTEEEREKLWIEKLEKNERWILGERLDMHEGPEAYYNALAYARELNKQLGYGNDEKNWNREKYEHERRKLVQAARLNDNMTEKQI